MSLNESMEAIQMYVMCAAGTNDSLPDNSWCQHRPSQEILNVYMQFKNEKWALAPEMRLNKHTPLWTSFSVPTPKALFVCVKRIKVMRLSKLWKKIESHVTMRGQRRSTSPAP